MARNADRDIAAPTNGLNETPGADPEDEQPDPSEVDRFGRAVDELVEYTITTSVLEARLSAFKRAVEAQSRWHEEDREHLVAELARYSQQVVRSWVIIIARADGAPDRPGSELLTLSEWETDQLAEEVVSRAVASFREELAGIRLWLGSDIPDMKRHFLLQCALQLPNAYRSFLLNTNRVSWDERERAATGAFDDIDDQATLLARLGDHVRHDRGRIDYLLQSVRYTKEEATEIIDTTLAVFELAAGECTTEDGEKR